MKPARSACKVNFAILQHLTKTIPNIYIFQNDFRKDFDNWENYERHKEIVRNVPLVLEVTVQRTVPYGFLDDLTEVYVNHPYYEVRFYYNHGPYCDNAFFILTGLKNVKQLINEFKKLNTNREKEIDGFMNKWYRQTDLEEKLFKMKHDF